VAAKGHTVVKDKAVAATCTEAGKKAGSHCSVCGTVIKAQATVAAKGHTTETTTKKATTSKNGSIVEECTRCGETVSTKVIYSPKTVTLSDSSVTWTGKAQKPSVTVKDSKGKTISSSNYTVSYAGGCKDVGVYTVKVTFKGNYKGSLSKSFTITPKSTTVSGVTAQSNGFTVKWSSQKAQGAGYQIQYSTSSKFTNAKTVTVSSSSTSSKSITKLSAKKKYYVRVRTYKKADGKTYYSDWSGTKSITTKK
jgi:hypothetical protein